MRSAACALLGGLALTVTGCTAGSSAPPPSVAATSASPTPAHSGGSQKPLPADATGLRGSPIGSAVCPAGPVEPSQSLKQISGAVTSFVICPARINADSAPGEPVTVAVQEPGFAALNDALAEPDTGLTELGPCEAKAQLPRVILVTTSEGSWSVHLPIDHCGFYSQTLIDALADIES